MSWRPWTPAAVVANQRTFDRGDIVFHEGDPGDSLHLVRQGIFAIRSSTPSGAILIVDILAPGDVFGEFAVFSNQRRRTTEVTALSPGATLTVEREQLRAAIGFRPELAEELIATIIGKAESTTQRLVEMLYVPAELRVLRALLSMATLEDAPSPVRLTQDELASFAATTRPTADARIPPGGRARHGRAFARNSRDGARPSTPGRTGRDRSLSRHARSDLAEPAWGDVSSTRHSQCGHRYRGCPPNHLRFVHAVSV